MYTITLPRLPDWSCGKKVAKLCGLGAVHNFGQSIDAVIRRRITRFRLLLIFLAAITWNAAFAQEQTAEHVEVSGENEGEHDQFTEMGEYAQPAWAERSRFSSTTSVYVLSPYELFVGNVWEADFREG